MSTPTPHQARPVSTTRALLRLHRVLWGRSFNGNPSQVFMVIFLLIYGILGCLGLGLSILVSADGADFRMMGLTLTAGTLAYWLLTLMWPSSENQLDPGRLATLPLPVRSMAPGLMWASVLQTRGALALVNSIITFAFGTGALAAAAGRGALFVPLAAAVAGWAVAVALALPVTIMGGEAISSFGSAVGTRTKKERLGLLGFLLFLAVILGFNVAASAGVDAELLARIGTVLSWTPLGAAGGIGVSVAYGRWLFAALQLVITLAGLRVGWMLWRAGLASSLKSIAETGKDASTTRGTGQLLLPWVKPTVGGTLYSRGLRYWRRDTRFLYSAITMPILALFALMAGYLKHASGGSSSSGASGTEMYGAFLLATCAALNMANDYGYDGPANWVHMVAGVRGRTMIAARMAVATTMTAPLVLLYLILLGALEGFDSTWALLAVACPAGMLAGLGMGAYLSVANPFPTSRPGTNPMKDRSGYSSGAFIAMFGVLFGVWVPMVPGIVMMNIGGAWFWAGAGLCAVVGVGGMLLGYRLAAQRLGQRWPEVLGKVRAWV